MKMEHYFNLPVNSVYPCAYVKHSRPDITKAAAHAINCHDELVNALQAITDNYFLWADPDMTNDYDVKLDEKMKAGLAALEKAKGERQSLNR